MSSNSSISQSHEEGAILPSNPKLPIIIIVIGSLLGLLPTSSIPAIIFVSFGLFLLIQSFTLKLKFTEKDLVVLQLGRELRRFPFSKWIAWRIFLPGLPGLLYFREEASPHLLPILFNCESLRTELQKKVGNLEVQIESDET